MAKFSQPDIPLPDAAANDPRVGHLLGRALEDGSEPPVVILGFPSDEGVRRNKGRPGAAAGPDAIRRALYRFAPGSEAVQTLLENSRDLGNLQLGPDLEKNQQQLGEAVGTWLAEGTVVVILGGGHETGYGHFLGYVTAGQTVRIVNIDAHADVRELRDGQGHSGSPFRQALEHVSGHCAGYSVAGLQYQSNAAAHLEYLREGGARAVFADHVDETLIDSLYLDEGGPVMATFCLDAVDQAFAPGVSAPNPGGLSSSLWLHAARRAGTSTAVRSMDIAELNPRFDQDEHTARLAALTVLQFFRGLTERV